MTSGSCQELIRGMFLSAHYKLLFQFLKLFESLFLCSLFTAKDKLTKISPETFETPFFPPTPTLARRELQFSSFHPPNSCQQRTSTAFPLAATSHHTQRKTTAVKCPPFILKAPPPSRVRTNESTSELLSVLQLVPGFWQVKTSLLMPRGPVL